MRKAIVGDRQTISLKLDGAKAGEVYKVTVTIEHPNGKMTTTHIDYKFYNSIVVIRDSKTSRRGKANG